jgi:hypothetical protein
MKRTDKKAKKYNSLFIRDLMDQFEENERQAKENMRELIDDTVKIMMANELQEIIDRQEAAYQRVMNRYK